MKKINVKWFYDKSLLGEEIPVFFETLSEKLGRQITIIDWSSENLKSLVGTMEEEEGENKSIKFLLLNPITIGDVEKYPFKCGVHNGETVLLNDWSNGFSQHNTDCFDEVAQSEYLSRITINKTYNSVIFLGNKNRIIPLLEGFSLSVPIEKRNFFCKIFEKRIVEEIGKLQSIEEFKISEVADTYIEFLKKYGINMLREVTENFDKIQADYLSHLRAMVKEEKEMFVLSERKEMIRDKYVGKMEHIPEKISIVKIFGSLIDNGSFEKFEFMDDMIVANTGKIYIVCEGRKYYIGKFEIIVQLDGKVIMKNIDNSASEDHQSYYNLDHPHISRTLPCLGTLKEIIPKLISSGDFLQIFILLYEFLISYNKSGVFTGGKISNWKRETISKTGEPILEFDDGDCDRDYDDEDEDYDEDDEDYIPIDGDDEY